MAKSNKNWFFIGLIGIIVLLILWGMSQYNTLVTLDENVNLSWDNVETQYQRRADLVPNLVSTVQGAADFEQDTLTAVTEARTQWQSTASNPGASLDEQLAAANNFDSALARLLVTVEAYPTLTATQGFRDLQVQLEGTENRISVARTDFNTSVNQFNKTARRFPINLFANAFGFEIKEGFEAQAGAEDAPVVDFE